MMKNLLSVILVLAFCIPASAELVIYKMTCRERLFYDDTDCPEMERVTETMWLILDIDLEELVMFECGKVDVLGGDAIMNGAIFKTWRVGRNKFLGWDELYDMELYILDKRCYVKTQLCEGDVMCFMEGKIDRHNVARSLSGSLFIENLYMGVGTCNARLDRRLMRKIAKLGGTNIIHVIDYLASQQPAAAKIQDICDPLLYD